MNNDTGGAVVTHNLLLKRDPSSTEHLVHKQKMASILASPQAARKKRFVKLKLESLEASPPAGANPFHDHKVARGTTQHDSKPNPGYAEKERTEPSSSILTTYPILMPNGGFSPHNPESDQGHYKGLIGREAALGLGMYL
ncbi:unnamed protein product [Sphagnum jensenii]|uniref:Uncharacterized protein n=1 Tax=Sphagnum jensenii TaxID=128206 RepID=A0ABP1AHB9_9BRYO